MALVGGKIFFKLEIFSRRDGSESSCPAPRSASVDRLLLRPRGHRRRRKPRLIMTQTPTRSSDAKTPRSSSLTLTSSVLGCSRVRSLRKVVLEEAIFGTSRVALRASPIRMLRTNSTTSCTEFQRNCLARAFTTNPSIASVSKRAQIWKPGNPKLGSKLKIRTAGSNGIVASLPVAVQMTMRVKCSDG